MIGKIITDRIADRLRRWLGLQVCSYCGRDILTTERREFAGFIGQPCCVHCIGNFAEIVRNEQEDVERIRAAKETQR